MNYLEIIKKAYNVTIKNKILWLFGMLIGGGTSFSGCSGSYNFNNFNFDDIDRKINLNKFAILNYVHAYWYIIILIALLLILCGIIAVFFTMVARGALFHGISEVSLNKKVSFKDSFKFGLLKFWRVLGIQLIISSVILVVMSAVALPIFLLFIIQIIDRIIGVILIIFGFLLILFVALIITLLINYIYCFAILKNQKIIESIKSGWNLFKKNFKDSILIALILFGIILASCIAIFIILLPIIILFISLGLAAYFTIKWIGVVIVAVIGILILLIINLFFKSILNVFVYSSWFYTWQELINKK